jgi:hypothetical protein
MSRASLALALFMLAACDPSDPASSSNDAGAALDATRAQERDADADSGVADAMPDATDATEEAPKELRDAIARADISSCFVVTAFAGWMTFTADVSWKVSPEGRVTDAKVLTASTYCNEVVATRRLQDLKLPRRARSHEGRTHFVYRRCNVDCDRK